VKGKCVLFWRKEPKDFYFSAAPTIEAPTLKESGRIFPWAPDVKVFCFFSSEKKDFVLASFRGARGVYAY
jgi:hypothetical protein